MPRMRLRNPRQARIPHRIKANVRSKYMKKIGIIAEYTPTFQPHVATSEAIEHSRHVLGLQVEYEWISTSVIDDSFFQQFDGLWVAPGSPYKSMEKTLKTIQYAREHGIPTIGTCGGFQHIMIEYARNVLGIKDAEHAEYDPYASDLFISKLECSLAGREMYLKLIEGSKIAQIYGATSVREKYYCNFGVNPDRLSDIKKGAIQITGSDVEGEVRVVEYHNHPFFIATLFVPQTLSTPEKPHPLINAFLKAVIESEPVAGANDYRWLDLGNLQPQKR